MKMNVTGVYVLVAFVSIMLLILMSAIVGSMLNKQDKRYRQNMGVASYEIHLKRTRVFLILPFAVAFLILGIIIVCVGVMESADAGTMVWCAIAFGGPAIFCFAFIAYEYRWKICVQGENISVQTLFGQKKLRFSDICYVRVHHVKAKSHMANDTYEVHTGRFPESAEKAFMFGDNCIGYELLVRKLEECDLIWMKSGF